MQVEIDPNSGFCFGVTNAIKMAEEYLNKNDVLYCLGDIVHNGEEVKRLSNMGMQTVDHKDLKELHDVDVLIRAHGEPPSTYRIAAENNIRLIDATCPVVLRLQENIHEWSKEMNKQGGLIVIFGKKGHAEVNGLVGQTCRNAMVVNSMDDLQNLDLTKPLHLFSQTTRNETEYQQIAEEIKRQKIALTGQSDDLTFHQTICPRVSGRENDLADFASSNDVIIFVSGKKSSNGRMLYDICMAHNDNAHFISSEKEIQAAWFESSDKVGICGATSTPYWLMKNVSYYIIQLGERL